MNTKLFSISLSLLLAAAPLGAQTNSLTALLQQGLVEEQANRNLDAAIADYQSLAARFDQDRQIAAMAVFRLGECYRALGRTNDAAAQYQRILRDFPAEQTLANLSRQNLAGMGAPLESGAAAGREQQKALLEKQITLAEQDLSDSKAKAQVGQATPAEVRAAEREVLRLRQQLAGLDSPRRELLDLSVPATTEDDQAILRIQEMIQNSPDLINAGDPTPLCTAAQKGQMKVVNFLLDHGADINLARQRWTPLHAATQVGNKAMVELLLSRGAQVNAQDNDGDTPLRLAVGNGFQTVTEILLAHKADVNLADKKGFAPIHAAAMQKGPKLVQMLLVAGADANANYGRTPLSLAAEAGSVEVIRALLAAKADVNGGDRDAPLLEAIHKENRAAVEVLLAAGANPNGKGAVDWRVELDGATWVGGMTMTPLFLAVTTAQLPMVELLLKAKADPNDTRTKGQSLLFRALDKTGILKALLEAGAKAEAAELITPNGPMPLPAGNVQPYHASLLQLAALRNLPEVVALLVAHGANPKLADERGRTPLHEAAANLADETVLTLLLDHGANPNAPDKDGDTPLFIAKRALQASGWTARFETPDAREAQAQKLVALLHARGALDNVPDWGRIKFSRPSADVAQTVFSRGTNHWNHFTLLEFLYSVYPGPGGIAFYGREAGAAFPDLAHLTIVRPAADGAERQRIPLNLLNATNGVDCSRDVPLEFGDEVEVPEREHTLVEPRTFLTYEQALTILQYLSSKAGTVKLVVKGGLTVAIPLPATTPLVGTVLIGNAASSALTSNSDLSRVKVTRTDAATGKKSEWVLDCRKAVESHQGFQAPDLWLRNGDVIEVPER